MNPRVKVKVLRVGRYEVSPHLPQYVLSDEGVRLSGSVEKMIDIPLEHAELMAKTDWLEIVRELDPVDENKKPESPAGRFLKGSGYGSKNRHHRKTIKNE